MKFAVINARFTAAAAPPAHSRSTSSSSGRPQRGCCDTLLLLPGPQPPGRSHQAARRNRRPVRFSDSGRRRTSSAKKRRRHCSRSAVPPPPILVHFPQKCPRSHRQPCPVAACPSDDAAIYSSVTGTKRQNTAMEAPVRGGHAGGKPGGFAISEGRSDAKRRRWLFPQTQGKRIRNSGGEQSRSRIRTENGHPDDRDGGRDADSVVPGAQKRTKWCESRTKRWGLSLSVPRSPASSPLAQKPARAHTCAACAGAPEVERGEEEPEGGGLHRSLDGDGAAHLLALRAAEGGGGGRTLSELAGERRSERRRRRRGGCNFGGREGAREVRAWPKTRGSQ